MAGFLASLSDRLQLDKLAALFGKKSGSVVGIDVGSSSIKVVQLTRKHGSAVLDTYGELSLGPYAETDIGRSTNLAPEIIAQALTDLLEESGVTTAVSGLSIPYASSLISLMKLPNVDPRKLNDIVPMEARRYIPVPINEVMLDWFIVPTEGTEDVSNGDSSNARGKQKRGKTDVMLVAIHNETLNRFSRIVTLANLEADFFEIEIFSAIRATLDNRRGVGPVMVVDMGAATTKTYVVEFGVVRLSHIINRGSQDITLSMSRATGMSVARAEELKREMGLGTQDHEVKQAMVLTLDYIFSQTNRVLLNYEKKYNKNVGRIVLTGGGATMKGLLPLAQEKLDTNVELGDPYSKIEAPAFLENVLQEAGPSFTVAVGLALRKLAELE